MLNSNIVNRDFKTVNSAENVRVSFEILVISSEDWPSVRAC